MRHLVLLRGVPGAGKSTWVKTTGLEQFTLSPDNIRLMIQTPVLTESGEFAISQKNDKQVWRLLFELLEARMERGELTIIDATHTKTSDFNKYKKLKEFYRYRTWCVDFTNVPIEVAKERNLQRPVYKRVPEEVIDNMYSRFATQKVPGWVTVIPPGQLISNISIKPLNFSEYKRIHHIGDLHGCLTPLKQYFDEHGFHEDELYIFVGDYVDRGIENAALLRHLFELVDKPNVIFLEGNHEWHLWRWSNNLEARSKEFENVTKPELEAKGIDKSKVRGFYRKLRQLAWYSYGNYEVLVTHGGLSTPPRSDSILFKNFPSIATQQLIKGVGDYGTDIDDVFTKLSYNDQLYQVHGHRNTKNVPILPEGGRSLNLEGHVEFGGHLRIATLSKDGWQTYEIKNNIVKERYSKTIENTAVTAEEKSIPEFTNQSLLEALENNKYIRKNRYDSITAYNFKAEVFEKELWDEQTIKARGLFINTNTTEIVARSYDKFFNEGEREETRLQTLASTLKFPVSVWEKYNGFLGILGYDSESDQLLFCSKSTLNGNFAQWFKEIFYNTTELNLEKEAELKSFLKENNVSMVFEVIDPKRDPHIIEYGEQQVYLLDIIKRQPEFETIGYSELLTIAVKFGFNPKTLLKTLKSWEEFITWRTEVLSDNYHRKETLEGFVIEDANRFMFKLKLPYYKFWKHMRYIKLCVLTGKEVPTGSLLTPVANKFYAWLRTQPRNQVRKDIITLRKKFYEEQESGISCRPCPAAANYKECEYFSGQRKCNFTNLTMPCGKKGICCGFCKNVKRLLLKP